MAAIGFPQEKIEQVQSAAAEVVEQAQLITPTGQNTEEAKKAAFLALQSAFQGFGLPFHFGRATTSPLATLFSAYLATLKNTQPISDNPQVTMALDFVHSIVNNMDPAKDPINDLISQSGEMSSTLAQGLVESLPSMIGLVTSVIFPQTQARSMESVLGDVSGMLNGMIATLMNLITGAMGLPGAFVEQAFGGAQAAINNLTNIRTEKSGLDGGFDIAKQTLSSGQFIISQLNSSVHSMTDPVINMLEVEMANNIKVVNDNIEKAMQDMFNSIDSGSMSACAAPISQSLRSVGNGFNNALLTCLRTEVNTLLKPLQTTWDALEATEQTLDTANNVLNSCLNWDIWGCGWGVGPMIGSVMGVSGNFASISLDATAFSTIQYRIPTCIAVEAVRTLDVSNIIADGIHSCMKRS